MPAAKSAAEAQTAAVAALKKLGGTYITKHAATIAGIALSAPDVETAEQRVRAAIGHTSVGARRAAELTRVAREAAAAAPAPFVCLGATCPGCSSCDRMRPMPNLGGA